MTITDVKVRRLLDDERLKAIVSITLDGEFAVHDIKVIDSGGRLFVAMPSRKDQEGVYRDIAHPVTSAFREMTERLVLSAYRAALSA